MENKSEQISNARNRSLAVGNWRKTMGVLMVALGAKLLLDSLGDGLVRSVFQQLPAQLAAWYWGVPLEPSALGLEVRGVVLKITRACAATDFCAMVFAVLVFSRWRWFAPLVAWGVTILANAVRIILLVPAESCFPRPAAPIAHMGVGVLVFLPVLVAVWHWLNRATAAESEEIDERSRNQ